MPGTLAERAGLLRAALRRDSRTRRIPLGDVLRGSFSWYGLSRSRIARSFHTEAAQEGLLWVRLGDYGLAWPAASPIDHLTTALVELRAVSNAHFYFREPTRVLKGDVVLDVGACEGAFALECLTRYGADSVWCFEPSPGMARALRHTAERNGLHGRMHVVEAAVSSVAGTSRLVEDGRNPLVARLSDPTDAAEYAVATEVPRVTLDEWTRAHGLARVDYVKIDAEGSDVRVLEGARELIRRDRPRIAVTTYHDPAHCDQIIGLLSALEAGYRWVVRGAVVHGSIARPALLHACAEA